MPDFLLPLLPEYTIIIPNDPVAWIGWGFWLVLLVILLLFLRKEKARLNPQRLPLLALLSVMVLLLTPFFGFLPGNVKQDQEGIAPIQHVMVFAAVPWMLAAGMVGLIPGVFVAGMTGLLLAYLDTHNIFTPLIFMSFAGVFGIFVRQRYRGKFYQWLRFPLVASGASLLILLPLVFFSVLLSVDGTIAMRVGRAFDLFPAIMISLGIIVLIGGAISSVLWIFTRKLWTSNKPLQSSPEATSLKYQWATAAAPLLIGMLIAVFSASWLVNEQNARQFKVQQLTGKASLIADSLSTYYHSKETALLNLADDIVLSSSLEMIEDVFTAAQEKPYFDQLTLMDQSGNPIFTSSADNDAQLKPDEMDLLALQNELMGDALSTVTATPDLENHLVDFNLFVVISRSMGDENQILLGKIRLEHNSNEIPVFNMLNEFGQTGGLAQVVGRNGTLLYHPDLIRVGDAYTGAVTATPTYTEIPLETGQEYLTYFYPIRDLGWGLVLSIPVQVVYEIAWTQTLPILVFGTSSVLITMLVILLGLNPLIKIINQMKLAASYVLKGHEPREFELEKPMGEIGQFFDVFKDLLKNQHRQAGKLNNRAEPDDNIADPADLPRTLKRLMSQALPRDVSSVRVVLTRSSRADGSISQDQRYGLGGYTQIFAHNDEIIAKRTYQEGLFVLNNTPLEQTLKVTKRELVPNLLIASPLSWKNQWLGAVWVTYQDLPSSGHEEIAFIKSLSERLSQAVVTAQSLENSKELSYQLEALLNRMPEAVIIADAEGVILFDNEAAKKLLSQENQPLRGQRLINLFSGDPAAWIEKTKTHPMKREIHFPGEKIFQIFVDKLPLYQGRVGVGIILRDITQEKSKESMKTEFVATVSHELRSPLTIIHGYAKILRLTGNLNEQQDATMRKIIDGIEEMKHLVQNLLDISRLEDETTLEFEQIDAVRLAKEALKSMEAQARQNNTRVSCSSPDSPIYIQANTTYLKQALKNLLDNAIKFTKLGGQVAVTVRTQEKDVIFSVQDNGIGVAPLDQHRLFDKFQRINPSSGIESEGSGLGLAIVRSVAERHGGKVWVESQLGEGSTFYLQIPKSQNRWI